MELKSFRKLHNFTQAQIGEYLQIPQQNYYRYEREIIEIPLHHLVALADLYECTLDELVGRTNKKNPQTAEAVRGLDLEVR